MAALDRKKRAALLDGMKQDIRERKVYANKIFGLVVAWLIGVGALLLASSAKWPGQCFEIRMSDGVLIALIGGTTASVISLFAIVANYLFPKRNGDQTTE